MKRGFLCLMLIFLLGMTLVHVGEAQAMDKDNSACLNDLGFDLKDAKEVQKGKKILVTLTNGAVITFSESQQIVAIYNPVALDEEGNQELKPYEIKRIVGMVAKKLISNSDYILAHHYDYDGVNSIYRYERKLMDNYTDPYDAYEFVLNRYTGHLGNFIKKYVEHPTFDAQKIMSVKEASKKGQELMDLYHFSEPSQVKLTVVNPKDLRDIRGEKRAVSDKLYYAYSISNGRQTIFIRADNGNTLGMLEYEKYDDESHPEMEDSIVVRIYRWFLGLFR